MQAPRPTVKRRPLTTTSYALLALLSLRSWTTYELAQQLERSLAFVWPRARSHLYAEPKNLAAHGLASVTREHTGRRPRTVYAITEPGRAALRDWLARPTEAVAPLFESEALVKITFAEAGSVDDLRARLAELRELLDGWHDDNLGRTREYLESGGPFPGRLVLIALVSQFVYEYRGALRRWAHWAEREVATWAEVDDPDPTLPARVFEAHLQGRAPDPPPAGPRRSP